MPLDINLKKKTDKVDNSFLKIQKEKDQKPESEKDSPRPEIIPENSEEDFGLGLFD